MQLSIRFNISSLLVCIFLLCSCGDNSMGPNPDKPHPNKPHNNKPSISSFSPSLGPSGTVVTIKGQNFSSSKSGNTVKFGDKPVTVLEVGLSNNLEVKVPKGVEVGKVPITVTVNGQTGQSSKKFLVTSPPSITSLSRFKGSPGTQVIIHGKNFMPKSSRDTVRFGDIPVAVDSAMANQLKVHVPDGIDPGKVSVSVTIGNQKVTAAQKFNVIKSDYTSEYAYNVNVVYFSPSNVNPLANYRERLSKILLNVRKFYGHWMNHWGYGHKTFGLLVDKSSGRVKIIHIIGNHPSSYYPAQGPGGDRVIKEVNAYFDAHPNDKTSRHTLVILPKYPGHKTQGGPYFSYSGHWSFVADNQFMNVKYLGLTGKKGDGATKYIGGLAHELGHGLGLPHDAADVTETQKFGTSIMGGGNGTYGQEPTFVTEASCAILNVQSIFSKTKDHFMVRPMQR